MKTFNKKGEAGDTLRSYLVYIILALIFTSTLLYFITAQRNDSDLWADYYLKEIVKGINFAEPGDSICLDIHKATEIAEAQEVIDSNLITINNEKNEACVQLAGNIKRCTYYTNDVFVNVNSESIKPAGGTNKDGALVNTWCVTIEEKTITETEVAEE